MPKSTTLAKSETALAKPAPGQTYADMRALAATVPDVFDDPTERMVAAILEADNPQDWEELFSAIHFKDSANKRFRVNTFRVTTSAYQGGPGFFLILDVTDKETGESGIMTCGSTMAMAQLLNAWKRGQLPIDVEILKKETPTKNGFYPMRLRYIGPSQTPIGDPAAVVSEQ